MGQGRVRIGTSGWVYKHWMGIFYPDKMPGKEQLAFYAERFDTVEINYTFYKLPEKSAFECWAQETPSNFLFAVKASRYLTHMKKLNDPGEPLARLLGNEAGLGEKLGPVLFQFPHNWQRNTARLATFLDALKRYHSHRWAFEFRHESWLCKEIYSLLESAGAALCIPVHPELPCDIRLTAPWSYMRFHTGEHGTGLSNGEIIRWAKIVREFRKDGADIYAYFNNDPEGHALRDAEALRDKLGAGD